MIGFDVLGWGRVCYLCFSGLVILLITVLVWTGLLVCLRSPVVGILCWFLNFRLWLELLSDVCGLSCCGNLFCVDLLGCRLFG